MSESKEIFTKEIVDKHIEECGKQINGLYTQIQGVEGVLKYLKAIKDGFEWKVEVKDESEKS